MTAADGPRAPWLCIPLLLLAACGEESVAPKPEPVDPDPPTPGLSLVWPLSATDDADADSVHSPYGPRWIGSYDFHAGLDLPAASGTPVRAVMTGRVAQVRTWDGSSSGAGNAILMHHDGGRSTSYLHLHSAQVREGDRVEAGEIIGRVGRTGATYNHLHLGFMVDLPGDRVDERRSRNPLELLPHSAPPAPAAPMFPDSHTVHLELPLQSMTVRAIHLEGEGEERVLDYYDVVALGSGPRNGQEQGGIVIDTDRPTGGSFPLILEVAPPRFLVEGVVVLDIHGDTLISARRPD